MESTLKLEIVSLKEIHAGKMNQLTSTIQTLIERKETLEKILKENEIDASKDNIFD